ncbi:nitric oxide reductase activation protein NorD [Nocardia sp. NPDC051750]|uniref:nitric oxide reductase activation protein NorD n=1 Tax=Nocardia sp. NPDC051750 TaxID=3364325 RepID=UPI0037A17C16
MTGSDSGPALELERSCALTAVAFSGRRRKGVHLITGERRIFGLDSGHTMVRVPYPPAPGWSRRTVTCGIALQCAPSKERVARYRIHELSPRELGGLSLVEGGVALGWIAARLPGLVPELRRVLPDLELIDPDLPASDIIDRAIELSRSHPRLSVDPLLGAPPLSAPARGSISVAVRRMYGRMPWTTPRKDSYRAMSVPVGGDGGVRNPNLPPPSRPENDEIEIRSDQRTGIPYPEWNFWTGRFLPGHVAVLERKHPTRPRPPAPAAPEVQRWFEQRTHRAMKAGLEDGTDLDIDRYVGHFVDQLTGATPEPRVFRDLLPDSRDVATAVLLDGSSSLGAHNGRTFQVELACADALSRAMTLSRERHGLFVFTGNTRHRVEVRCLKDFDDPHFVDPSRVGLTTAGYTRLGAPIRHLTSRLLNQPAARRLLLVIGDGLISDEGYEGRYAWADVAHAVEEAEDAGVAIYYLGIGPVRVDPLPTVFGARRSRRLLRVDELPRILAHVHRELVAA